MIDEPKDEFALKNISEPSNYITITPEEVGAPEVNEPMVFVDGNEKRETETTAGMASVHQVNESARQNRIVKIQSIIDRLRRITTEKYVHPYPKKESAAQDDPDDILGDENQVSPEANSMPNTPDTTGPLSHPIPEVLNPEITVVEDSEGRVSRMAAALGSFIRFQKDRIVTYGSMVAIEFLENRRGAQFEKNKEKFSNADDKVFAIKNRILNLEQVYSAKSDIDPRDLEKINKEKTRLEHELADAVAERQNAIELTRRSEVAVKSLEEKKQLIAEQFAHLAGERIQPHEDACEVLRAKKDMLSQELGVWKRRLDRQTETLYIIKELGANNPFLKETTKARIKAAELKVAESRSALQERSERMLENEKALSKSAGVVQKWSVKRDAYAKFAEEKFETFEHEMFDPTSSPIEFEPFAEFQGGFEFDHWATAWNQLFGSKLPVDMERIFDSNIVSLHRAHRTEINSSQFAALVHNYNDALDPTKQIRMSKKEIAKMAQEVERRLRFSAKQSTQAA